MSIADLIPTTTDDVVLAELVEHDDDLALAEARAVTDEAREALWHAAAAVERAVDLVARAAEMRAHEILIDAETGLPYGTWKRYCQVELLGLRSLKIAVEDRLALVGALVERGVSRRGVAEAIGMSEGTMRLDLKELARREEAAAAPAQAAITPPLAVEVIAERVRTKVELVFDALHSFKRRGGTGPQIDDLYGWRRGTAGAILSELHTGRRVLRLSVLERSGTRLHEGQPFAVYVAWSHEGRRATEGPGRRSRAGHRRAA